MRLNAARLSRKVLVIAVGFALILSLAACAPDVGSKQGGEGPEENAAMAFSWTPESDCSTCHENASSSFGNAACTAAGMVALEGSCMTCHDDETGLAEAHENVALDSVKKRATLKKTEVSGSVCESCHDKAAIAEATAESTVLTDANGTVVNPHDIPVNEDHEGAGITCSSCHKVHAEDGPQVTAPSVCNNCHHHKVYECGTCHT